MSLVQFCFCGCGTDITNRRLGTMWASESCRKAFLRGRAPANASISRPKRRARPSGAQGALGKIQRSMELLLIRVAPDLPPAKADRLVKVHSLYTLSERQRALLEQREAGMNDKPRTWTLVGNDPFELPVVEAGAVLVGEEVRVVELEPMLDLLECLTAENGPDIESILEGEALLKEHGRLEET